MIYKSTLARLHVLRCVFYVNEKTYTIWPEGRVPAKVNKKDAPKVGFIVYLLEFTSFSLMVSTLKWLIIPIN